MGLQQLLDDDQDPGNTREGFLTDSEREDIGTAICLIERLDVVFRVLHRRELADDLKTEGGL